MSFVAAAVTVATTVGGAMYNAHQARKAKSANNAIVSGATKAGAFDPLTIPKPQKLKVPGAENILSSWRGEVGGKFPEYDAIAGKLNASEQEAARYANTAANPDYYTTLGQITSNALQASQGRIPEDVKQNILRQANEDSYLRGFNYGTPSGGSKPYAGGNDAAANLALRNLGLTSLDMMKYGDALSGQVLDQSRASRGTVMSAKDVVPTSQIFQDQMNAQAVAQYNYASDKAGYAAAVKNAPIQAAYNKLALQMGVQAQNNAIGAQASTNNAQLAMSALQALGGLYGGSSTLGLGKSASNAPASTGYMAGVGNAASSFDGAYVNNGMWYNNANRPVADAPTITAIK
jgi:hypothetical protein